MYGFKSCRGEVHFFLMEKKRGESLESWKLESEENIYSEQKETKHHPPLSLYKYIYIYIYSDNQSVNIIHTYIYIYIYTSIMVIQK